MWLEEQLTTALKEVDGASQNKGLSWLLPSRLPKP